MSTSRGQIVGHSGHKGLTLQAHYKELFYFNLSTSLEHSPFAHNTFSLLKNLKYMCINTV